MTNKISKILEKQHPTKVITFLFVAVMILSAFAMLNFASAPNSMTFSNSAQSLVNSSYVHPLTVEYHAYFDESGLPSGTSWSVTYDGTLYSSTTTTIEITLTTSGTYSYSIPFADSGSYSYPPYPSSGTLSDTGTLDVAFGANISASATTTDVGIKLWFYSTMADAGIASSYAVNLWVGSVNATSASFNTSSSSVSASYTFLSSGTYSVYFLWWEPAAAGPPAPTSFITSTLTVTINPTLSVSISASATTIDYGQSITFESSVSGGTSPYFYQWNVNNVNVTGATNSTYTTSTLPVGTDTIKLWVSDSAGDPSNSKPNVSVPNVIMQDNIPVSSDGVYIGDPVNISIDRVGDIPLSGNHSDFSYQWYGPGGPIAGATSWFLNVVEDNAGFYNFAVHIKILNSSLPYHGTWIGHFHLTVKNNILPSGSVEFIESGLPSGAAWSAALASSIVPYGNRTSPIGPVITGVDGYYTTVGGNGLPTVVITPPNGTYHFFVYDYRWGTVVQGLQGWVSPGNYTPSISTGVLTFPLNTANHSTIIRIQFTPISSPSNDPPNLTRATLDNATLNATLKNSIPNTTILPIARQNSSIPPVITKTIPRQISRPAFSVVSFIFLSLAAICLILSALGIQRFKRKKQKDREAKR